MADIEITTKPSKSTLSGDERLLLHDPASPDGVSVTTWAAAAEYMIASGLVGAAQLAELAIELSAVDVDAVPGTLVGTISGRNPRSTLSVEPSGYYTVADDQILKGELSYSLAGQYPIAVIETLAGSPNSPHVTAATVSLTRDLTPTLGKRWSPDYFPERFLNIWDQESLPVGPVAAHRAGGWLGHTATQTAAANRPVKRPDQGGVEFAWQSARSLVIPNISDGEKLHRWSLMMFRIDPAGTAPPPIYTVNDVYSSGGLIPQMQPTTANQLRIRWRGNFGDSFSWGFTSTNMVADGATWNVALTHRRNGSIFANLNGVPCTPDATNPSAPFTCAAQTAAGLVGTSATNGARWAYDAIVQGQGELSDALVQKLEGWAAHRRGAQSGLPADHPYRINPPVIDADDFPDVYKFDATLWADAGASASNQARFVNRGKPPPPEPPMVTVFRDDFRADSVNRSAALSGGPTEFHACWFAPGHNTAVGVNATLNRKQDLPNCYVHDPVAETMTLRLQHDTAQNRWESGAFYSIDDAGTGRSWAGERVYEMRVTFPQSPLVGGLFPAFWAYALEHMVNRIGERIEIDFFEHDGQNRQWLNGLASHVHSGQFPGRLGHLASDAPSFKVCGFTLNTANMGTEINHWDGQPHTWQARIMNDFTYLIVDNIECARIPTPREYLRRSYLLADMALRANLGAGVPGQIYDMIIHHIEVRQPLAKVESFALPFLGRPMLSGAAEVGQTITCEPRLPPGLARSADFWWFRSGYPITGHRSASYTIVDADVGQRIRCMVKAVGATNQPEAWTEETAVVAASGGSNVGEAEASGLTFFGEPIVAEGNRLVVSS